MEEEINYDIMRYELDENGYITNVYFGCASGTCMAYEGEMPDGYEDLQDWYESNYEILNAWFISDGNLVYDAARATALQETYVEEEDANGLVHRYEIYGLEEKINQNSETLKEQYQTSTLTGNLIEVDNSKALSPNIKITNVSGNLELIASNKNMLPNEAATQTISGVSFEQNDDRSITLNGTSTEEIEYNIVGTGTNASSIFVFKKDVNYYLSSNDYQIKMYNFDGVEREEVYSGAGGTITFTENRNVTQIVLCIPNETTLTDVTIYPQLELGSTGTNYVMPNAYSLKIDLTDIPNIEYVNVIGDEVYIKTTDNEEEYYVEGYLGMHEGYNVVYSIQDATLELTYYTDALNVESLEFMEGKSTTNNQFKILEDGSMEAHNGNFSGTITANEGNLGGFTLGEETFTSPIYAPFDLTLEDAQRIIDYSIGKITLTDEELELYDVDGDGIVGAGDAFDIARVVAANVSKTEPGSLEINSKSVFKTILLKDKDGNECVNLNINGIKIKGDDVITEGHEILQPEIITAYSSEGHTMSTSLNYDAIGVDAIHCQVGTKFELATTTGLTTNVTGVKIPSGITKVKISSNMAFTNNNQTSAMYFTGYIYKTKADGSSGANGTLVGRCVTPKIEVGTSTAGAISPLLIEVEEGDVLYLRAYKSVASGNASIGSGVRTYLTVEKVE